MSSAAFPPVALTVAGSDSGGGAGLQADLKTWEALGVFGTSVVTSVTAQNTREVRVVDAVAEDLVRAQLDAVFDDLPVAVVKTGLLPTASMVRVVTEGLRAHGAPLLVVDPVLVATSGDELAGADVGGAVLESLAAIATLLTPNLREAEVLSGRSVAGLSEMRDAARALSDRCGAAVLIKGGHLWGAAVDVLLDEAGFEEFAAERIPGGPVHGTGCTLSAAIAAGLAAGKPLRESVGVAKRYVHSALRGAFTLGAGARVLAHRSR
ncbi:MAG: bifunctional hydroxymethylpyrimidine kinase/phosphomethylpyrimidine kinase [Candidatus Binatia bacterium]|nr:bifunctional hydroxymethylpyrimidine kinase/phosphomethylpyrimidine kinase [Candidatus Binatia bacterium]